MPDSTTFPESGQHVRPQADRLTLAAGWTDPVSHAVFIHKDLLPVPSLGPWFEEEHIPPQHADERFGDVESWASYLKRHASAVVPPFISWNVHGIHAVLDYHTQDRPGRCRWNASYPFERAPAFRDWVALQSRAYAQGETIEFLEAHQPDIVEPAAGEILTILRTLRTTVNKAATVELREDGTNEIQYQGGTTATGRGGVVPLPPLIKIQVQVLKGHTEPTPDADATDGLKRDDRGQVVMREVLYRLEVRLRVHVDNTNKPSFRFEIPQVERVLEDVFADRIRMAQALLSEGEGASTAYQVLRGADRRE